MATTLASLSAADKTDFLQRLSTFGVTESAIQQTDLVVPAEQTVTLSATDAKSAVKPQILTTTNLDQLKTWIGVPDTLYTAKKLDVARVAVPKAAAPTAAVSAANLSDVHQAAYAYLFGQSTLAASYKATIEKYFKNFQIIFWPFYTITLNAGSTLVIGPGQNVLSAWKIIIHNGGKISAPHGNLKTSATILQKVA